MNTIMLIGSILSFIFLLLALLICFTMFFLLYRIYKIEKRIKNGIQLNIMQIQQEYEEGDVFDR